MAEIFISYARVDRERAQMLAGALGHEGWSVWWDRDIPPGRTFDDVIEEALTAARCVIVVWSRDSVRSEWVKAEASEAVRRHILVPVLADEVMPPLEFRRIQSAALLEWGSVTSNPDWSHLCQAVGSLVGKAAVGAPSGSPTAATRSPQASTSTPPPQGRGRLRVGVLAASTLALVVAGSAWVVVSRRSEPAAPTPNAASAPVTHESPAPQVDPQAAQRGGTAAPAESAPPTSPPTSVEPSPSAKLAAPGAAASRPGRRPASARDPAAAAARAPHSSEPSNPGRREVAPPPDPAHAAGETRVTAHAVGNDASGTIAPPPPRGVNAVSFDVAYTRGVFRESGRLTISPDGVQYAESGGRSSFQADCGDLRRVQMMTLIVDGQQRMVELHFKDRVHRFTTESTVARDGLVSALSRACGTR